MLVGGILLTHLQNLPCNAHELSEIDIPGGSVKETVQSEIGKFYRWILDIHMLFAGYPANNRISAIFVVFGTPPPA